MKFKNKKVIEVQDWDELVFNTYKRPYSFQQQDGCKDRGTFELTIPAESDDFVNVNIPEVVNGPSMGVSFKAWLARDPKQKLSSCDSDIGYEIGLWWDRNFYPHVQMIANDLYKKKLIPAGDYLINIDW